MSEAVAASTVERGQTFAEINDDALATPTHLLLAVMAANETVWPQRIAERGGFTFERAVKLLHYPDLAKFASIELQRYRVSVRLTIIAVLAASFSIFIQKLRLRIEPAPLPPLDRAATEVMELAGSFGSSHLHPPDADIGRLLLALATTPGRHLRLLDNPTVLACAVRRDLGLDRWHHRLIVRLDWPKLVTRRMRAWLVAGVTRHGRVSTWSLGLLLFRTVGVFSALVFFLLTVPATLVLYLFLWPALILTTGVRVTVGSFVGLETRVHKWYEMPGGEIALAGPGDRVPPRHLAAVILIPRFVAFACCIVALVLVTWRSQRLGVALLPTVFTRPDLLLGLEPHAAILTPISFFSDALTQNGLLQGTGLLAGLGAGILSVPSYREIALVRLHAGHDSGQGSWLGRVITLPAAIITGAFACIEALLPLRNGPIYLTVYTVPLATAFLTAIAIDSLLPY